MRRIIILLIGLVIISPLFGVILADKVGYHEPLDIAAEKLGLEEKEAFHLPSLFPDYSVPGLNPVLGYIISGLAGVGIILGLGALISRVVSRGKR